MSLYWQLVRFYVQLPHLMVLILYLRQELVRSGVAFDKLADDDQKIADNEKLIENSTVCRAWGTTACAICAVSGALHEPIICALFL